MSDGMNPDDIRTLMEDQLRLSRQLRERITELEDEQHAPVAVVGMGLRFPPAINTPEAYWDFLRGPGTALADIPEDRPGLRSVYDPVPGKTGRSYVDRAGFLTDIAGFDADFFGISQREARLLDPQQRMLLETSWEALERAGVAVRRSDRLNVGVYLGMMTSEYSERNEDRSDMSRIDPYYITGGGLSFGAGRVSYLMGFSGPVMGVETACSSSLTTLHLAVRALRARECRYALAGGANLLLSATLMVSLCQTRALSPDGRSKSFLATADGYGRGEGVGVLALMRLDDAEREGRPVLAVIRGTAVNHDGAASGLTAPNGPAQQEVIRAALADARIAPEELGFVEAHGTGTVLGDPIEIGALDGVLGKAVRRRGTPLTIGSVKSRLGHLEGASGIASVMKAALMLQHGVIPAAADPDDGELNPHIPWDRLGFRVPRKNLPWPAELARKVVGVNSFGMSGTNVHAVLEAHEPESAGPRSAGAPRTELITLSAKDPEGLDRLAEEVVAHLKHTDAARLPSVCHTLRAGRAPFPYRLVATGTTTDGLSEALAKAADAHRAQPTAATPPRTVTLVVTGPPQPLRAAVEVLAAAFPALSDAAGDADAAPGPRLAAVLGLLGVRVRQREATAHESGATAWIEWATDGRPQLWPLVGAEPDSAPELLVTALGELFAAGAELSLAALRGPGTAFVGDLPTYPFRHRRFWIDEPAVDATGVRAAGSQIAAPSSLDPEELTTYLAAQLQEVLQADDLDLDLSFLEVGGDSFMSTLFITRVQEHFEVGMTADQLSLDMPLRELLEKLAESIAAANANAGQGWKV
ncbi:beta-ketoacyl synthase N-terminal-like domain-containing protein [Streptomyces sp. ADMS]|uniref:type I polyketide synthase n=1 Tax=Streptomyces sp. ADMS TaxID=3071415 RepID=UPI00296E8D60|nr:beta-ketoacyl synthase N-terminal-like domain-containing protein [Streptomyces sp. ADMS]MDW4905795.1 beta-ketoacyl synthase N-terminal-like domain-containing protein [Streptomyces sp. ADMS]